LRKQIETPPLSKLEGPNQSITAIVSLRVPRFELIRSVLQLHPSTLMVTSWVTIVCVGGEAWQLSSVIVPVNVHEPANVDSPP